MENTENPHAQANSILYHIQRGENRMGPYSLSEVQHFCATGLLVPTDYIWTPGMANWAPLTEVVGKSQRDTSASPPPPPHQSVAPIRPRTYMLESIIVTLLCCLPFGIAATVYASQVDTKYNAGDFVGAQNSSIKARTWYLAALLSGLGIIILAIIGSMP